MSELKNLINNLAYKNGTSGSEDDIAEELVGLAGKFMTAYRDSYGNAVATLEGKGKTFLLDAHMDRIGMIVTAIEDGFLRIDKCGGADARVMAAQDVTVWGKEPVYGVITSTPPHLTTAEDAKKVKGFDSMLVDIGMSMEEAKKIISPGDRVTVRCPQLDLCGDRICSAALDDRAGCAVILRAAEIVAQSAEHPTVKLMFSCSEETGGSGAKTGSFSVQADECISVDVSFAAAHGMTDKKYGILGKGPMIGYAPILNYAASEKLKAVAEEKGIPYQVEIMGEATGTNADHIAVTKGGIKTALISIPLRNMHTGAEIISVSDIENSARLIAEYILGGGTDA
ncbi:MAG: M20/M25/M40 family metallo-hydrolase [Clostridia bacterium]|nr:M20/M25/M40 family metallo-hydrolase [Clostridia bacterium]